MSEKANKIRIGAFVLGALALLLIAVTVISSGRLFSTPVRFVMFFDSSLKGLSVGSPVLFRGIPWGRVTDIRMSGNAAALEFLFPVYVELDASILKDLGQISSANVDTWDRDIMMQQRFRARLNYQSLLTGQLLIELDCFPDAHQRESFMPIAVHDSLLVIPTIPSRFDAVWQRLSEIPVDKLVQNLTDVLVKVDDILETRAAQDLTGNINSTMLEMRSAVSAMGAAMESLNHLIVTVDKQAPETLERINVLLGQLERNLENMSGVVGPNTVTVLEFNNAIREISETAKTIRDLANTLERNPESLFMGKGE